MCVPLSFDKISLVPYSQNNNHLQFNTVYVADIVSIRLEQNNIICNIICISALLFASPIFIRTVKKGLHSFGGSFTRRVTEDKRLNTVISKTHDNSCHNIFYSCPNASELRKKNRMWSQKDMQYSWIISVKRYNRRLTYQWQIIR